MIAGGHDLTCSAASDVMRSGGNAIDAAIAALACMFVAEPAMASPGAGGFATVKFTDQAAQVFDFFCQTPLRKKPIHEVHYEEVIVDFGDDKETFYAGNGSSAVPGMMAGIFEMHKHYGTIDIQELFQPAISAMKEGLALNDFQQFDLNLLRQIFLLEDEGRHIFGKGSGLKEVGDLVLMPRLADFMETVAIEGPDLFYKGEIAKEIESIHKESGGLLTRKDLEDYKVAVNGGRSFQKNGVQFWTVGAPFLGGLILETLLSRYMEFSNDRDLRMKHMTELFQSVAMIQKNESALHKAINGEALPMPNKRGATSHFSLIDPSGNAVSLTTSIGEGSGLFLPGSQIHLNNMLGELALLPGDLHSWVPNRRLNSMMTPTIAQMKNGDLLILGTGGAGRIPYVLTSYIVDYLVKYPQIDLEAINNLPRVFATTDTIHAESPIEVSQLTDSKYKRQWKGLSLFFGGVNAVAKIGDKLFASGDSRRDGHIETI